MVYEFKNKDELKTFLNENVINTNDTTIMLNCTRQYIDKLVIGKKLIPIKIFPRDKLFLKEDIIEFQEKRKKKS